MNIKISFKKYHVTLTIISKEITFYKIVKLSL